MKVLHVFARINALNHYMRNIITTGEKQVPQNRIVYPDGFYWMVAYSNTHDLRAAVSGIEFDQIIIDPDVDFGIDVHIPEFLASRCRPTPTDKTEKYDFKIDINDFRIDEMITGEGFGRSINGVRLTYFPLNIVIEESRYRSQHKNRSVAMDLLHIEIQNHNRRIIKSTEIEAKIIDGTNIVDLEKFQWIDPTEYDGVAQLQLRVERLEALLQTKAGINTLKLALKD